MNINTQKIPAASEDRTHDLEHPRQTLYSLGQRPSVTLDGYKLYIKAMGKFVLVIFSVGIAMEGGVAYVN